MEKLKLPVEEFTTPDPVTAPEDASFHELNELMSKHGIRHLPILRGERVVGIVSDRDLKLVAGLSWDEKNQIQASDIMALNPFSVEAQSTLDEVAYEMSKRKIGSVIVNEGSKFVGIFTSTDALNALVEILRKKGNSE